MTVVMMVLNRQVSTVIVSVEIVVCVRQYVSQKLCTFLRLEVLVTAEFSPTEIFDFLFPIDAVVLLGHDRLQTVDEVFPILGPFVPPFK